MAIPGFSAEVSLYRTSKQYQTGVQVDELPRKWVPDLPGEG